MLDRIVRVVVTPVAFPDPPLLNVAGVHEPLALRTIVQVFTEAGNVGLGEAHGGRALLQSIRAAAEAVTGLSVAQTETARDAVQAVSTGSVDRIFAPIEGAMLDAFAQRLECRVVDLLGGEARQQVEYAGYLFFKLPHHLDAPVPDEWGEVRTGGDIVGLAQTLEALHGFQSFKLKGGVWPIQAELDAIRAVKEAFPAASVRIDPNAAWSLDASLAATERMTDVLEYLEDPCKGFAEMADITARTKIPIATNMLAGSFANSIRTIKLRAADIVLLDHHVVGGLRRAVAVADMCAVSGLAVSMHSNSHLGISLAAMTHLAAAVRGDVRASDTHYPWNCQFDILEGGPLSIAGGEVRLPDGHGLGVRVDDARLAEAHERYLATDIRDRNDGNYARRLIPTFGQDGQPWTFQRSGWMR